MGRKKKEEIPQQEVVEVKEKKPRVPRKKKEEAAVEAVQEAVNNFTEAAITHEFPVEPYAEYEDKFIIDIQLTAILHNKTIGEKAAVERFSKLFNLPYKLIYKNKKIGNLIESKLVGTCRFDKFLDFNAYLQVITKQNDKLAVNNRLTNIWKGGTVNYIGALGEAKHQILVYINNDSRETIATRVHIAIIPKTNEVVEQLCVIKQSNIVKLYEEYGAALKDAIDNLILFE